ncbi:hypothetical protein CIHG_05910 [Coccidioides immitis H538.4]|uniref:Uncharacterized protein n=1 Tax=Coccidioides immitis H538.4 TaxID=396776 RepID=A0A0J8RTQ5_COCIT|nr:hypothetical protein CIHG_05910 [Coccidioides immitis H538.4]
MFPTLFPCPTKYIKLPTTGTKFSGRYSRERNHIVTTLPTPPPDEGAGQEVCQGGAFGEDEEGGGERGEWTGGEGQKGRLRDVGEEEHGCGYDDGEGESRGEGGEEWAPEASLKVSMAAGMDG